MIERILPPSLAIGGFKFKPQRSSGPVLNGIGSGGGSAGGRSTLLTISGYTGSGKSALARMLVRRLGYQMLTLATTRPASKVEQDGLDYHFMPEADFMEGLQKGEIIGCEGGYGSYYGIPRSQIESLVTADKNGVVVAGASLMDSLKAFCQGRTDVNFRSALVRLPGTPQERYTEVVRRIEKRAREEGRDAAERLAKVSPEALSAYDSRAGFYDFELINGDFNLAGQALREYVQAVEQGKTSAKTERVPIRNTLKVILSRYLYRRLEMLVEKFASQNFTSYETIIRDVSDILGEGLSSFMQAVFEEYHKGEVPGKGFATTHKHILDVTAGILQTKVELAQLGKEMKGIGRLFTIDDQARAQNNLEAIRAISGKYPAQHLLRLALLHDVTKLAEWYLHPLLSYEVMGRLDLCRDLALSPEEKSLYLLTTRYHVLLSCNLMPDLTGQALIDFLKDPRVKDYLAPEGKVDTSKAEQLLDSLFLLAVADISPYGAALTNLKFEGMLAHRERLLNALLMHPDDYGSAIPELTRGLPELNRQYLGMILGISDPQMDQQINPGHYWKIMEGRMDELLPPEDKQFIVDNIHLLDTPFQPYNYLARITAEGMIISGLHLEPTVELFKFLLYNIQLARLLSQSGRPLHFCMQCSDGRSVSNKEELQAVALELFNAMRTATVSPEISGSRIYIKDQAGARIDGIEIMINENGVEGAREINFRFLNIK